MTIRVLVADDHWIVREGLRNVLASEPDIEVIGEAEDGHQALEMTEKVRPDVVVMDIAMPNLNGLEATRQIRRRSPSVNVVILTMHEDKLYFLQIVKAGAMGCVLKRSMGRELVEAIRAAARGESHFPSAMVTTVVQDYRRLLDSPVSEDMNPLTEREREILQLVAEGQTNREIADLLTVSIKTVQTHRANLMEKLGAHDRTDLVKFAIKLGLIPAD
ncbi:MAG TPA: response regulator transcription factor [Chloroflexota bacterium]